MAQTVDDSLEQRIADLEAAVRAIRATDPFGLIADTATPMVEMYGTGPSTVGGVGWFAGGPAVTIYVGSGRLKVDVAAALVAAGNHCSAFMSYAILGPALTAAAAPSSPLVPVFAAYDRAVEVQHNGQGQDQRGSAGTFGLHTGLAPGWYHVTSRYALTYSGSPLTPYGAISNRRLSAMPY